MRKAELLKHIPREPDFRDPKKRSDTARYTRKKILLASADIFQTKDGQEILELDLWQGKVLAARYFADIGHNSHFSFFPAKGLWKKYNINNTALYIQMGEAFCRSMTYWTHEEWDYFSKEDEERTNSHVRKFTNWQGSSALQEWEYQVMSRRRTQYLLNRKAKIAAMMDEAVPDIPEGFQSWAESKFGHYILQEKTNEGVECTCTACLASWIQPKGISSKLRPCPKCGTEVRGRYAREVSNVPKGKRRDSTRLILMQPCKDNGLHPGKTEEDLFEIRERWMERFFWVNATWDREGRHLYLTEGIRIFLKKGETKGECWYLHWIDRDGNEEWDISNPPQWRYGSGYVYPETLKEAGELWNLGQIRSGITTLAEKGIQFDANAMIINAVKKPAWEYLVKTGLTRIVVEDVKETGLWGYETGILKHDGKTAKEVLRLDGNRIDRLRKMDGGRIALSWLRYEQTVGLHITDETIRRYERRGYTAEGMWAMLAYIRSPERLINFLEKQAAAAGESVPWAITEYKDYLSMAKRQGLDLANDIFARPKDLKKAHDDCVMYEKAHEIELKADGIRKKFPRVEAVMAAIYRKYMYTDGIFTIVVPQKIEDIIREGRILGHCIDTTDRYFDRIEQNISYLVFLRKAKDPDKPWYTLEIEPGGTVRQQRTTGNNQNKADAEAYMPFIRKWQKEVRKRITAADRDLADRSKRVRIQEYQELREKKETVWHGIMAGKLLADVLEADLIEGVG